MPRPASARRRNRAVRASGRNPIDKLISGFFGAGILLVMLPKALMSTLPGMTAVARLQKYGWMLLALGLAIPTAWGLDVFRVIEWRRFEALMEALFAQAGFITRSQTHGADGGVDIWLHSKNQPDGTPVSIVQCKHWSDTKPVGVDKICLSHGVMVVCAESLIWIFPKCDLPAFSNSEQQNQWSFYDI